MFFHIAVESPAALRERKVRLIPQAPREAFRAVHPSLPFHCFGNTFGIQDKQVTHAKLQLPLFVGRVGDHPEGNAAGYEFRFLIPGSPDYRVVVPRVDVPEGERLRIKGGKNTGDKAGGGGIWLRESPNST